MKSVFHNSAPLTVSYMSTLKKTAISAKFFEGQGHSSRSLRVRGCILRGFFERPTAFFEKSSREWRHSSRALLGFFETAIGVLREGYWGSSRPLLALIDTGIEPLPLVYHWCSIGLLESGLAAARTVRENYTNSV
jgi:hypothetical protein